MILLPAEYMPHLREILLTHRGLKFTGWVTVEGLAKAVFTCPNPVDIGQRFSFTGEAKDPRDAYNIAYGEYQMNFPDPPGVPVGQTA